MTTTSTTFALCDLRLARNDALLAEFVALYDQAFTDPAIREDPGLWPERLWGEPIAGQPATHIIVACEHGTMLGGVVAEYYPASRCGLISYIVVAERARRRGIARELLNVARRALESDAAADDATLRALFAETERTESADGRREALSKLGARRIPIPYVQPDLGNGAGRVRTLDFLAFTEDLSLPGDLVRAFLAEFYRALDIAEPQVDPDFQRMAKHLTGPIALERLAPGESHVGAGLRPAPTKADIALEEPALALAHAAICLHFLETPAAAAASRPPYDGCPVLQSMELDLLNYAFQHDPPINSHCLNQEGRQPAPLTIHFPSEYTFLSEGRTERRRCPTPDRQAEAMVSYTDFRTSGLRIWHLTLVPAEGEVFTEFDLIRLIHTYDGRTELSALREQIGFTHGTQTGLDIHTLLPHLVEALHWEDLPPPVATQTELRAGTVAVLLDEAMAEWMAPLLVQLAQTNDDSAAAERLGVWIDEAEALGRAIPALCGIVNGILDCAEIDASEALDILAPTLASPGAYYRVHRSTLTYLTDGDRVQEASRHTIGISPYLILPHAVLIHNEALLEGAIAEATEVLANPDASLTRLSEAASAIERRLDRCYLGNIFNYATERTLLERGAAQRGAEDRLALARSTLSEVQSALTGAWEARHDRGQQIIATLLAALSALQGQGVLFEALGEGTPLGLKWLALLALSGGIGYAIFALWGMGRRQASR